MNDDELFEQGCFSPEWVTDERKETQATQVFTRQHKDMPTLLKELDEIKKNSGNSGKAVDSCKKDLFS